VALVVVDAENARRSLWPNLTADELVTRARAWAEREGHELLLVFDGEPPELASDLAGAPHADDEIAVRVGDAEGPVWVVTSDRELRRRIDQRVERIIGGGSFVREL
jgi:hypothetical protein